MVSEVILFFAALSAIIFIGHFSEIIFKKTKIPDVLILIILGIFIGSIFKLIDKNSFGFAASLFTTFTLVYLLFQGALSIDFKTLFRSLKGTFKLSIISFFFTTIVVSLICFIIFRFEFLTSLLIGTILSGTSSAVVIPIVSNFKINKKYSSILTLESAISDVFAIVASITIIAIIIEGNINTALIFKNIISSFILSLFIGAIIGVFWILILAKSKELKNSYMVTIALIIALYAFVESPLISSSGAIAVLAFGLMLGNSRAILKLFRKIHKQENEQMLEQSVLSTSAKNFYAEISFFVKVFFFVYLGILFDFTKPLFLFFGFLLSVAIYLIRIPTTKLAFYREKIDKRSKLMLRYIIPKGLAAAALAQLAIENNINRAGDIVNIVFSVILFTIIITSVLIFWISKKEKEELED